MKKIIPTLFMGISLLIFGSCIGSRPLVNTQADNNTTYKVQYLFEHDGCKVYRFLDMGHYVYFTNCTGNTMAIANDSTAQYVQVAGSPKVVSE